MWERYKCNAILRCYALSTLWVVTVPSFIVVVDTLNASIYISIAQGFGIALIGTIIGVFFVSSAERRQSLDITSVLQKEINTVLVNASHNKEERKQKVIEYFILFLSLFGTIFIIYGICGVSLDRMSTCMIYIHVAI